MGRLIGSHFERILHGKIEETASDYSEELVCIIHTNGKSLTLAGRLAADLLQAMWKEIPFGGTDGVRILVNRHSSDYGVLTVDSGAFSPFISYTCIVKHGKIAYATLYLFELKKDIFPEKAAQMPKGKAVKRLFHKHVRAMFSRNADVIVKDYAQDAVVITNMAKDVCRGKPEIHRFCSQLMESSWEIVKQMKFHGFPKLRWKTKSAVNGLMLFVCEADAIGSVMTETYWVEDDKIKFEASVCGGDMLEIVDKVCSSFIV